ncbi:MAG: PduL/EutD family phosphate acyltransferase [Steroidobacteraceae bacterium]|jgi:propanediol utilization protein
MSGREQVRIPVAISAPHVYLTADVIEELFCDKYRLHVQSPLSQAMQFAAEESVTLIGPRGRISNVRIIGPPRSANQVEVSKSDALTLGIDAPVRESGDLAGTPGILIAGPRASARLHSGVIRPLPHVHMTPADAARFNVKDHDRVDVVSASNGRAALFQKVIVHVSPRFRLELHLNADEGSATGLRSGDYVLLSATNPGTINQDQPS